MAIAFTQIPAGLLVPGQYQEIDNSLAGETGDIKTALIVGVKTKTGKAQAGVPVNVVSASQAADACGYGSPAAIMAASFLSINKTEKLYVLPIEEPSAGTAWKREYTVEAANAGAGSVMLTINGRSVWAAVSAGLTADKIAAAIVAACNGLENNPIEATADGAGKITFSSIYKGIAGNKNTLEVKSLAAGVTVKAGTKTDGTGVADLSKLPEMLGAKRWNYIVFDFDDEASIKVLAEELESRYSATRQIGGRAFVALSGKIGSASEAGSILAQAAKINSPHICLIPRGDAVSLPCEWASRFAASACRVLADDPSANTYDTKITGLGADSEYDFDTRQKLLEAGVATWRLDPTGNMLIERLVTSYTENTDGGRDTSYLDIQVVETVDAVRTYINAEAKKRFKTWKLANTDENFGAGAKVMTPGIWRSFLADLYQTVFIGQKNWCQDFESYKASILVEVKAGSKTRLEYRHQPVLIGQFLIGAGLNQFK
ncbi:phage tail sheath protein [Treponema lecithinolyticum]|uniref:phage tail sheath protein n=1 Tax=Treponema lecithinolyticum TaxID=53418 RepID=UPI0028E1B020|nr:phage tail sheath protein [Treponema lecithinolyticum]